MLKRGFVFAVFSFASLFCAFSAALASNATLNIEAYKSETPLANGNLEIKVYRFGETSEGASAEIQGFSQEIDVTERISAATDSASAMAAFSIVISTNLGYNFNFKIRLNPFVSDRDGTKVPVSYSLDCSSSWQETSTSGGSRRRYRYRFESSNAPATMEVGNEEIKFVNLEIKAQTRRGGGGSWSSHQITHGEVLTGSSAKATATINARMWMDAADYENILGNVNYRSHVVITVEVV